MAKTKQQSVETNDQEVEIKRKRKPSKKKATKRKPPPLRVPKPPERKLDIIYNPWDMKRAVQRGEITMADIRGEYMRLRKIITQRLATMKKYGRDDTRFYKNNYDKYKPQSQLSDVEVRASLAQVYTQLLNKDSSVAGQDRQRKKQSDFLKLEYGIELTDAEQWRLFGDVMRRMREIYADKMLDSDQFVKWLATQDIRQVYKDVVLSTTTKPPAEYLQYLEEQQEKDQD